MSCIQVSPQRWVLMAIVLGTVLLSSAPADAAEDYFCVGDGHHGALNVTTANKVVNSYAQVTANVAIGATTITVDSVGGIKAKDLIMLHQSTGYALPAASLGSQTTINLASSKVGRYELARVLSISGTTLTLVDPMVNAFDANYTQAVLVPEYTTVTVAKAASIIPKAWNGKTGGIIAFLVNGLIDNSGQITAIGGGFRGGTYINQSPFTTGCTALNGPKPPQTVTTGEYGQKGEGIAPAHFNQYSTGRANAANGGGGGNCSNSGGGGGGSAGQGGKGGRSWFGDNSRDVGGYGGAAVTYSLLTHLMFGGAGGAGHGNNSYGSHGGRGGGVVFIRGLKLVGTGVIDADGQLGKFLDPKLNFDGQAGGGGGGSLLLRISQTANCQVIRAEGANGLDMSYHNAHGPGGGGGGGRVFMEMLKIGSNCKLSVIGGTAGTCVNVQNNCTGPSVGAKATHGSSSGVSGHLEANGTTPYGCDQDKDCIKDILEGSKDTDGDKIPDFKDTDSDNDKIPDKLEDKNCNGKRDPKETDRVDPDTDKDGLKDGWTDKNKNGKWDVGEGEDRNNNGTVDTGETDPLDKDTDDGCRTDGEEELTDKTDPLKKSDDLTTKCGKDKDTDGDGILDKLEDKNGNGKQDPGETDWLNPDTDGDGLTDGWVDLDKDGKWDPGEGEDRDNDGVLDSGETDPLKYDTDGGCVGDGDEEKKHKTDPLKATDDKGDKKCDRDKDGLPDYIEDKNGNGKKDPGETDWEDPDTDDDGIKDGVEDKNKNGKRDTGETDPLDPDTDKDGLKDGWTDKNNNGKWDKGEGEDQDNDGVVDPGETDPLVWDTDGGCRGDGTEELVDGTDPLKKSDDKKEKCTGPDKDTDGDGIKDKIEDKNGNGKVDPGETDPKNPDTDGDGLTDGWVDKNKNGKWDKGEGEDRDNDGVKDSGETDPLQWDTDGGCSSDGEEELTYNTDPLNKADDKQGKKCSANNEGGNRDGGPDAGGLYFYGGGGCSVGGEAGTAGLMLLLPLALLWGMRRRRRIQQMSKRMLSAAVLVGLLAAAPAQAQTAQMSVLNFRLAASPLNFYVTEGAYTVPHLVPAAGLYLSYAHRPLELYNASTEDYEAEIVKYHFNMDLLVAIGLFDRFELGLALPINMAADSDDLSAIGRAPGSSVSAGLGDLRIIPKVRIFTDGPIGLAVAAPLSVPTGDPENFLGDEGVTFTPKAIFMVDTKRIDVALNVGFRIRTEQSFVVSRTQGPVTVNDELVLSLGFKVPVMKRKLELMADWFMSMSLEQQDKEEVPMELMFGGRYHLPYGLTANLGAGPGLTHGVGTPVFRVFAGLGYQYVPPPPGPARPACLDPDGDKICNKDDLCPNDPEDYDGFEDTDGCPDLDNDKDGILDQTDKCPNVPEDKDEYEDLDGCPEIDNDRDGLPDTRDRCPLEPEDRDGFGDLDGCPDKDNDKDGIPDLKDACPNRPETFNGVDDHDGCPDQGKGPVQVLPGRLKVPPVFFATNKDIILRRSEAVLMEVANTLMRNKWIKKVSVEGHTDSRNTNAFNMDLSIRRASNVLRFLVKQGVDPKRLTFQGHGEENPVADNKTRKGRAENRRVEFLIIEPKMMDTRSGAAVPPPPKY